jgi:hypothetical protein
VSIEELTTVKLTRPIDTGDRILPAGASGTVVHVYPDGRAYEVEFTRPFHVVATVAREDVA